jgi:curved DNA-binding protein CbpA
MNEIDPYNLLGVTIHTSLKDLKKSYHSLAMLCHPDKGGAKKDMIMVHQAYKYIQRQLEFASDETVEDKDYDFAEFIKNNKDILPSYNEIWKESTGSTFLEKFNTDFAEHQQSIMEIPNFEGGYGEFMEESDITYDSEIYEILRLKFNDSDGQRQIIRLIYSYITAVGQPFKNELIIYTEPSALPDHYGFNERLDLTETSDYSAATDSLGMSDYKMAHSGPELHPEDSKRATTLEELIAQRDEFIETFVPNGLD